MLAAWPLYPHQDAIDRSSTATENSLTDRLEAVGNFLLFRPITWVLKGKIRTCVDSIHNSPNAAKYISMTDPMNNGNVIRGSTCKVPDGNTDFGWRRNKTILCAIAALLVGLLDKIGPKQPTQLPKGAWFHTVSSTDIVWTQLAEDIINILPLPCAVGMSFSLGLQSKKLRFNGRHQCTSKKQEVTLLKKWVAIDMTETQQQQQHNYKADKHLDVNRTMTMVILIY